MNRSRCVNSLVGLLVLAVLLALLPGDANAAIVRGRVQRLYPNGVFPLPGIAVTLYNQAYGRTSAFWTDQAGMYYFTVPPAVYYLEIWPIPGGQPVVFGPFGVGEPGYDIPPVNI